jgi:hypothetical protein
MVESIGGGECDARDDWLSGLLENDERVPAECGGFVAERRDVGVCMCIFGGPPPLPCIIELPPCFCALMLPPPMEVDGGSGDIACEFVGDRSSLCIEMTVGLGEVECGDPIMDEFGWSSEEER